MTQCSFSDGTWSATIVLDTPGNQWSIAIAETAGTNATTAAASATTGYPRPDKYPGVDGMMKNPPSDSLSLQVLSRKGIASYLNPDTDDSQGQDDLLDTTRRSSTTTATDRSITLAPGLRSGSLDVWLTPHDVDGANLQFHISGSWSCE
ncbi:hypothetical protein [Actinospica robiniae]|uniref:hypothetical protein n=1 Tax=Actinospica robiniae TaxID=304901 RepID=UPI0012FA4FB0|nr:hypothetical protein [Actinospica robiniae]